MKVVKLVFGMICFLTSTSFAQTLTVKDILSFNEGKSFGSVKDNSSFSCDLEVDTKSVPHGFAVTAGMFANVTLMVYPADSWELDTAMNVMIYYENALKRNFIKFDFNPTSLKIKSFTFHRDNDQTAGNTCLLVPKSKSLLK